MSDVSYKKYSSTRKKVLWKHRFLQVISYLNEHGKYPTNRDFLYRWIDTQKNAYKNGKLDSERIKSLESLDNWNWTREAWEKSWERNFLQLKNFIKEHGRYPTNNSLHRWFRVQRNLYKNSRLSLNRIRKLESLENWKWTSDERYKKEWANNFLQLKNFIKEHGRYPTNNSLHRWVRFQKSAYKKGWLSSCRIKNLESLDNWNWTREEKWERNFLRLKRFVEEHGKYPSKNENLFLCEWIKSQKTSYKCNRLSSKQIKKLESLNGWFFRIKPVHAITKVNGLGF